MQTIADFYRYAITQMEKHKIYFGHGTEEVCSEAWWLVSGALKLPIEAPRTDFLNAKLQDDECLLLVNLIDQRVKERIPVAYLLNEAYQNGYKFYVDTRVLIPRSPIAELIEDQFMPWLIPEKTHRILELCTGSGSLAILTAHALPHVVIDAIELSAEALEVAQKNVLLHRVESQVRLLQSDLFNVLETQKYDLIFSNPPYVDANDLANMPPEYQHEPRLALAGGKDGLLVVKRILKEAKKYLNPEGILIVEVGNSEEALNKAYPHLPFVWLELTQGGHGVFLLHAKDLADHDEA